MGMRGAVGSCQRIRNTRARFVGIMVTSSENPPPGDHATRPSLLLRMRDPADAEAWRVFVETYTPMIFAYCRRRGLQTSDVSDITQEVMTQVSRSIRDFCYEPDRGRFRDWLGTVTRTKILGFLRKDARAGKGGGGDTADVLSQHLSAPETDTLWTEGFQARVLEVALARARPAFEDATWHAFERSWIHGQSASIVAEALSLPIDAVYVAKSRVLKRLREEVAMLAEDSPLLMTRRGS